MDVQNLTLFHMVVRIVLLTVDSIRKTLNVTVTLVSFRKI